MWLIGCSVKPQNNEPPPENGPESEDSLEILATVGMVADLVRLVGAEHVEVTQLMGSGVDPHLYKANRDDIQFVLESDAVFYSGHHLEGKMTDTLEKLSKQKPVIAVGEEINQDDLVQSSESQIQVDPHLWMNISIWSQGLEVVANALSSLDPKHADTYTENAKNALSQFRDLHQYGIEVIGSIPQEKRVLITSHDAFQYFGDAYEIEVLGVQGISTESEAGLQRINAIVDLITDRKISAIFIESSVPRKNVDSLIEGARARGHEVIIGGELLSDAMGSEGSYEGSYLGMMDHNLTRVAQALGGEAPDSGFQRKLKTD